MNKFGKMKNLYFCLMSLWLLISCTTIQKVTKMEKIETPSRSAISNYLLFDVIEKLKANDYYTLLDSLKTGHAIDFFRLRMAYTKTKEYSPYNTTTSDRYKRIITLLDSLKFRKAISTADSILKENYVDIKSHLYCGYAYKELNDSAKSTYHYSVYKGLLTSIYESGDGQSAGTAYIIIITREEYAYLQAFNLGMMSQRLQKLQGHYFDLLEVMDPETKETHLIFFNIDIPFKFLDNIFYQKK